jgi:hypothetical protein
MGGYYSSDDYRVLKIYLNEKDALNKMIQLCKNNGGYSIKQLNNLI